jgi:clan AA aspartic protease
MGTFSIQIAVGNQNRERWTALDALVDTGASISAVPASVLRDLGVEPITQQRFRFGQGETRVMDVGQTWVRVEGMERITLVLFNEENTPPLLGALALEGVFMGVDPVAQRLVPVEGLIGYILNSGNR